MAALNPATPPPQTMAVRIIAPFGLPARPDTRGHPAYNTLVFVYKNARDGQGAARAGRGGPARTRAKAPDRTGAPMARKSGLERGEADSTLGSQIYERIANQIFKGD